MEEAADGMRLPTYAHTFFGIATKQFKCRKTTVKKSAHSTACKPLHLHLTSTKKREILAVSGFDHASGGAPNALIISDQHHGTEHSSDADALLLEDDAIWGVGSHPGMQLDGCAFAPPSRPASAHAQSSTDSNADSYAQDEDARQPTSNMGDSCLCEVCPVLSVPIHSGSSADAAFSFIPAPRSSLNP